MCLDECVILLQAIACWLERLFCNQRFAMRMLMLENVKLSAANQCTLQEARGIPKVHP